MRLFVYTIREALLKVDQNATFVDSSPSNGITSEDPYHKRCALRGFAWGFACPASAPFDMAAIHACYLNNDIEHGVLHAISL